jgi:hypothetical protein
MSSLKQIEANRENAKKSTGPRTPEGKEATRHNALKTGIEARSLIIPGESPDDLNELTTEFIERFLPTTPEERFLVDTLISSDWLRRRMLRIETQLLDKDMSFGYDPAAELGPAYLRFESTLVRLQRRLDANVRNFNKALKELERIQANREKAEPAPEPEQKERVNYKVAWIPYPVPERRKPLTSEELRPPIYEILPSGAENHAQTNGDGPAQGDPTGME